MIRPIDMQMILPRTESVGTEKQVEQQKIANTNTDAATEVAKEIQHNSETVVQKDANAFTEYKYDAKEEGNGTYRNPKKKKKNQNENQDEASDVKGEAVQKKKEPPRVNFQI
ncbi:MAG: hypothetical protein IJ661_00840 [Lachnospiraceae bacterium]|nr:hypothetical protein [Lachnospiraceae bacterium]